MLIGISGKKQSGKDTVALIIQYLTNSNQEQRIAKGYTVEEHFNMFLALTVFEQKWKVDWKIVRFADKLKDIVCLLTGCTRKQLENEEFKNSKLPIQWIRYGYADGFIKKYIGDGAMGEPIMTHKDCNKEIYEAHRKTNWQTAYKHEYTYREVLQYVGTDLFRRQFHSNTWTNATMADYKGEDVYEGTRFMDRGVYPKWIIPDVRFINEVEAIKSRGGIVIRINRDKQDDATKMDSHESETALDNYDKFDVIINNNGTIEDLIEQVRVCLKNNKLLK